MSPPTLHDLRALLREALSSPDVAAGVASAVREATPKDAAVALVQEVLDTDPRPGVRRAAAEGVAATIAHWDESRQRAFFAEAIAEVPQNEDALMAMGVQMLRLVAKSLGTPALTEEVARATIALETESRYPNSVLAPRLGRAWYDASHTPVAALAELRRLAADTAALEREPGLGGGLLLLLGVLEIAFGSVTDGLAAFERVPIASVLPVRVSQFLPVLSGSDLAHAASGLLLNVQLGWSGGALAALENVATALAEQGREADAERMRRWRDRRQANRRS